MKKKKRNQEKTKKTATKNKEVVHWFCGRGGSLCSSVYQLSFNDAVRISSGRAYLVRFFFLNIRCMKARKPDLWATTLALAPKSKRKMLNLNYAESVSPYCRLSSLLKSDVS